MPLDRSRIEYLIDDLKTRPERVRLLQRLGVAGGVVVALLLVFLLTRGGPPPKPKLKVTLPTSVDSMTQGVKDAFEYAKTAQAILNREARYSRVYFVPSAATPTQKYGKVVVMGELSTDADLEALQGELAKIGVPVPVEWQVAVQGAP
jgi:hypothetical protein